MGVIRKIDTGKLFSNLLRLFLYFLFIFYLSKNVQKCQKKGQFWAKWPKDVSTDGIFQFKILEINLVFRKPKDIVQRFKIVCWHNLEGNIGGLIIFGTFDNLLQQKHDQLFFCDWWDHCIFVCHCAHILVSAIKIHWSGALEYSLQTHLGTIWFFHVLVCGFNHILHIHVGLCHSPKEGVHLESEGNYLE